MILLEGNWVRVDDGGHWSVHVSGDVLLVCPALIKHSHILPAINNVRQPLDEFSPSPPSFPSSEFLSPVIDRAWKGFVLLATDIIPSFLLCPN